VAFRDLPSASTTDPTISFGEGENIEEPDTPIINEDSVILPDESLPPKVLKPKELVALQTEVLELQKEVLVS